MAGSEPVVAHRKVVASSDRSFGLVFAGFFALVAVLPLLHGGAVRWWALGVAAAFAAVAYLAPRLLRPLNKVWFAFGMLLHHVVNPVVMAVLFYGAVMPMGLVARALGKDLLRLKREPEAASYWIPRDQPAPAPKSMSKQF
jgi:hypothetical protein